MPKLSEEVEGSPDPPVEKRQRRCEGGLPIMTLTTLAWLGKPFRLRPQRLRVSGPRIAD
jgi:hypothetical protein